MQDWVKKGVLYENDLSSNPKLLSHAANPLPILIEGDIYRCYFSARDVNNRSSVGAVDINFSSREIVKRHERIFFEYGEKKSFYSHGVSLGNCYFVDDKHYMLFMGWRNEIGRHWYGQIGRLKVDSDLNLILDSPEPFLPIDDEDPLSMSYPCVVFHDQKYRMWYGSTVNWDAGNGEMLHVIKYAESNDGQNWVKHGQVITSEIGVAQAFSRPSVYVDEFNEFHMWFSYRSGCGESYRVGYSKSVDGLTWTFPKLALSVANSGWDCDMVEYPYVLRHKNELAMLYNGNSYGESGFGLARIGLDSLI